MAVQQSSLTHTYLSSYLVLLFVLLGSLVFNNRSHNSHVPTVLLTLQVLTYHLHNLHHSYPTDCFRNIRVNDLLLLSFRIPWRSVEGKHLKHFQSENAVFKFLQRGVEVRGVLPYKKTITTRLQSFSSAIEFFVLVAFFNSGLAMRGIPARFALAC